MTKLRAAVLALSLASMCRPSHEMFEISWLA